jgi:N-acetylglucosaminyl-diphospho-decaprenol L-rhamnosyltransferase
VLDEWWRARSNGCGAEVAQNVPRIARIAVVIVTYNSANVLADCLAALRDGAEGVDLSDVVVVDNASTDESIRVARDAAELTIQIVRLGTNRGYAAGFNAGVEALAGREPDAVLLINPDCRLRPGTLAVMAQALSAPGRGIVAPRLLNLDGTLQPTLRRAPTVRGALAEALVGGKLAGRMGLGELIFDESSHDRARSSAWATGAALLISWQAVVQVGPWNESFLLYSEETEFIFRAADRGWTMWYEPSAVVDHRGGESGTNPGLAALLIVNKVKLFRSRHSRSASAAYSLAVLLGESLRAMGGRATSQEAVAALLRPSRRITSLAELR